jgi:hypothetical protein
MLRFNHIVPFGVEVDVDLCRRTQDDDDALRLLFLKHHMLVFRDQALTKDEQVDFMSLFGPPLRSWREGVGYVTNDQGPENVLGTVGNTLLRRFMISHASCEPRTQSKEKLGAAL